MKSQKYIINDGNLIFGRVEFHEDLPGDHTKTTGGGWWHLDQEKETMYLYSASTKFGVATEVEARAAWKKSTNCYSGCKMIFSDKASLKDVLNEPD